MAKLLSNQMPAGKYYVGDLCYVMHVEWAEICTVICAEDVPHTWKIELNDGRLIAGSFTQYGDGEYESTLGKTLAVDAGLIGVIRTEDIAPDEVLNLSQGAIYTFDKPFSVSYNEGNIYIGDHIVYTGDMEDDDEDEDF